VTIIKYWSDGNLLLAAFLRRFNGVKWRFENSDHYIRISYDNFHEKKLPRFFPRNPLLFEAVPSRLRSRSADRRHRIYSAEPNELPGSRNSTQWPRERMEEACRIITHGIPWVTRRNGEIPEGRKGAGAGGSHAGKGKMWREDGRFLVLMRDNSLRSAGPRHPMGAPMRAHHANGGWWWCPASPGSNRAAATGRRKNRGSLN